jgi:hypothetical protein
MTERIMELFRKLHETDAVHRRGFTLNETTQIGRLNFVVGEIHELSASPHDIEEMADVLAVLFDYALTEGWTLPQIEEAMIKKVTTRWTPKAPETR